MSSSSTLCTIEKCEFLSLALCQCCKKDLCIAHLNEHSNQRSGKLLPLVDRINVLVNRFNQFYDGEQSELKQLEQWREQAYRLIDEFYQKKREEYSSSSNDPYRIQLHQIRTSLNELIRKKGGSQEDIERFSKELQTIEEHLDRLKHLPFALQPLTINEQCVLQVSTPNNQSSSSSISVATQTDEPISEKQEETEKNSKKKRKSHRRSDVSSDRSSRHQSRSPHRRDRRSKKRRGRSRGSRSSRGSSEAPMNCEDCRDCQFYQDRFGPGFMDKFGPCKCQCHNWAYEQAQASLKTNL